MIAHLLQLIDHLILCKYAQDPGRECKDRGCHNFVDRKVL